eukprot:scaffold24199_cov35-Attheya_sp.AAC.1
MTSRVSPFHRRGWPQKLCLVLVLFTLVLHLQVVHGSSSSSSSSRSSTAKSSKAKSGKGGKGKKKKGKKSKATITVGEEVEMDIVEYDYYLEFPQVERSFTEAEQEVVMKVFKNTYNSMNTELVVLDAE